MARTESTMLPLGTLAPDFSLPDVVSGYTLRLAHFSDRKGLLVMFICQHCPFVKHIETEIARIDRDYRTKGLGMVAISSNSTITHPQDSPEQLREQAQRLGFNFPYCFDETQAIAKAYNAVCTPDFFLFNADQRLVYRGQLDESRPGNDIPVTGKDLRAAIEALLADRPVDPNQKPSIGCNIKWHPA